MVVDGGAAFSQPFRRPTLSRKGGRESTAHTARPISKRPDFLLLWVLKLEVEPV